MYPADASLPIASNTCEQLVMPAVDRTSVGSKALRTVDTNLSTNLAEGVSCFAVTNTALHMLTRAFSRAIKSAGDREQDTPP